MKLAWYLLCFVLLASPAIGAEEEEVDQLEEKETGLRFIEVQWANEVHGYQDYEPNPKGLFQRGERAYVYMEVAGFESRYDEEKEAYHTDVTIDVRLRSRIGIPLFSENNMVDYVHWDSFQPNSLWFYIWVDIPGWAPRSTYQAEVTVRDRVGETEFKKARALDVQ